MSVQAKSFREIFNSDPWEGQQKFSDVTLKSGDGRIFQVHKAVLSQRSAYLRGFFNLALNIETVVIPNIDSTILEKILWYVYTGEITLNENNIEDLMVHAEYLLLNDLLKKCRSFVIRNLTSNNCLLYLSKVSRINEPFLLKTCYRYAFVYFDVILETPTSGLGEMPFDLFKGLLKNNSLNVLSERFVWEAIVKWTEADRPTRLSYVPELLNYLRLKEGDDENLAVEILSHTIITSNKYCRDLMQREQIYYYPSKCSLISENSRIERNRNQNSPYLHCPRVPNHLYVIARRTQTPTKCGTELFISYDNELDFCQLVDETDLLIHTMVQIGHFIYMFDEMDGIIFDIERDLILLTEISVEPYVDPFRLSLNEQLYSIGRSSLGLRHSVCTIWRYEFHRNRWQHISMPFSVFIYGATVLKDMIFIVGSTEIDSKSFLACLAYKPETYSWISMPPPNIYREQFTVVEFHEQVFVIGGKNKERYLRSVEVYNPTQNKWTSHPDLPFYYFFPKAVVVDEKIVVYENNNENMRYYNVAPTVYWEENAECWRTVDESSPLYWVPRHSFLLLDDFQLVAEVTARSRGRGFDWERIFNV